jgi:FG-GAP repeat
MRNRMNRIARNLTVVAIISTLIILLAMQILSIPSSASAHAASRPSDMLPTMQGPAAIRRLKKEGLYDSLRNAVVAAPYEARREGHPAMSLLPPAYYDANPARRLDASFPPDSLLLGPGLEVVDREAIYPATIAPAFSLQTVLDGGIGVDNDFGRSVAISGDLVVVGAPDDDVDANANQGAAYVFVRTGATWSAPQRLTASDGGAGDSFGYSVAVSGGTIVIGALFDNIGSNLDQGSAYVFVQVGTNWSQQTKLTGKGGEAFDEFGQSVAVSGDTVVVGVPGDDIGANANQGSAHVFQRNNDSRVPELATWSNQTLTADDGATDDEFGHSVAISGNALVVGAPFSTVQFALQGSAYVFGLNLSTWTQQQKLTASDGGDVELFGFSVAIDAGLLVVGAANDQIGANWGQGSAYVFERSYTVGGELVTWNERQKLTDYEGAEEDHFGSSVGIDGTTVVVGSPEDDIESNIDQGSASVFQYESHPIILQGTWRLKQKLTAAPPYLADPGRFGKSVCISSGRNTTVVVGAPDDHIFRVPCQDPPPRTCYEPLGTAYVFLSN